jgi:hypothetical protein
VNVITGPIMTETKDILVYILLSLLSEASSRELLLVLLEEEDSIYVGSNEGE